METRKNNAATAGLPYVNNIGSILFTVAVNTVCILVFSLNRKTVLLSVIIATVACCFVASFIDTFIAEKTVRKMRGEGKLPGCVPESKLMMRLPKNPALLGLIFAVFFAAVTLLVNLALIRFFEIQTFTLVRLLVWQAFVSCLVSAVMSECAVMRYVQKDCAGADDPAQTGDVKVKNPMSRVNAFKNWLGTILVDFGFNISIGLVFGATRVAEDHSVVINPTTRDGILAASVIIGIIITLRMAYPIMQKLCAARESGQLAPAEKSNAFLSALPKKPLHMTLALIIPVILLSYIVFLSVMTFFDFAVLSFFQFFVVRSAYTAVLSKGVIALATARYSQPQKEKAATADA